MFVVYLFIIVAAVMGLSVTLNIYKQKHEKRPLVCPFGADCHSVIHSNFSSFLGVGLEVYGSVYYAFIATVYLFLMAFPMFASDITIFLVTGATAAGFLFSIYLTFVQAFLIRSWCSWCLMSAGISTVIFVFTLVGLSISEITFIPLLIEYKSLVLMGHLLGFALGLGGATVTDVLFFRFLKNFHISKEENRILEMMSQVIWVGLFLVIISGIGLYIPNSEALNENPKFLVKMIAVLIITINGAVLNLFVSPKMTQIFFKKDSGVPVKNVHDLRKLAFTLGSVSFVSWYTAFILGVLKTTPFSFLELLGIYVGALILGMISSQIVEKNFCKKSSTIEH